MPLTQSREGATVQIERIGIEGTTARRLEELGISAGERLLVLKNAGHCPLVIGLGDAKLLLGRGIGARIDVLSAEIA